MTCVTLNNRRLQCSDAVRNFLNICLLSGKEVKCKTSRLSRSNSGEFFKVFNEYVERVHCSKCSICSESSRFELGLELIYWYSVKKIIFIYDCACLKKLKPHIYMQGLYKNWASQHRSQSMPRHASVEVSEQTRAY